MTTESKNIIMRNILYALIYLIMLMGTVVLFFAGPRLEALLYPPVDLFHIVEIERSEGRVVISGILYKNRGECSPTEIVLTTGGPPGAENTEILNVDFQDHVRTRPRGGQSWGPWVIQDGGIHGPVFTIYAVHRCHFFWNVQTSLHRGPSSDIFGD
jgi:hypothetical protein